jgi:hypothetical protein
MTRFTSIRAKLLVLFVAFGAAAYSAAPDHQAIATTTAGANQEVHPMKIQITSCRPPLDTSRPGLLGICGGGGYSLAAARADKRFKAVATNSMFNSGARRCHRPL